MDQTILTRSKIMHPFVKIVRLGHFPAGVCHGRNSASIYCKIEFKDDGNLSISGVVGPRSGGNAAGACGQIIMGFKEYDYRGYQSLSDIQPAPAWTADTIKRFFDVWHRWHLNDMRAGTLAQEEWLSSEA
jgi:hypothetical protein